MGIVSIDHEPCRPEKNSHWFWRNTHRLLRLCGWRKETSKNITEKNNFVLYDFPIPPFVRSRTSSEKMRVSFWNMTPCPVVNSFNVAEDRVTWIWWQQTLKERQMAQNQTWMFVEFFVCVIGVKIIPFKSRIFKEPLGYCVLGCLPTNRVWSSLAASQLVIGNVM